MNSNRVVVLAGGLSHERDVSLRSGRRVAEALREAGAEVDVRDVDADLLRLLREDPPDCVLPLLHGETGEDGAVREVLELVGLPYVGSRPSACRAAFDKPVAKEVVTRAGLLTPESVTLPHETFRELGAAAVMQALVAKIGLPLIVKPARGGSALGCTVVRDAAALPQAMVNAYAYGDTALVERFVEGTEVAVPVVDTGDGPRALHVRELDLPIGERGSRRHLMVAIAALGRELEATGDRSGQVALRITRPGELSGCVQGRSGPFLRKLRSGQ